jgi:acetyl-CoA carboxylase biotin carboxyl carrier protein
MSAMEIRAQLTANVLAVPVAVGTPVDEGAALATLESMKMEIPVLAERAGHVAAVKVSPGDVVQEGDPLVVLTVGTTRL